MPQTPSTTRRRLAALIVALATVATDFATGVGPAQAAPPTVAPTILGPDGTTVGANPILSWEPLPNVVKYRVEVFTNPSFSGTAAWKADVTNVSATPHTDLPLGTLHWRVAGMEVNTPGPFATASFVRDRVAGPVPVAPGDGAVLEHPEEPVVLRWEPVAGVKNYKVEVDDAADFINPLHSANTDITSWTLPTSLTLGQTYYWRVQGQGALAGVNTDFSPTQSYQLAWAANGTPSVPELTSPAPGATVTDVVLKWNPVPGAARYELQISPNGDWGGITPISVKGTSYSPAITLNNAAYFWRVRAMSPRNPADAGPWSPDGRQFTRAWGDVPTQEYPDDNDLETEDFLLRWDPVPYASGYELQVGTDPNFSTNTFQTCTTVHTDWSPYWQMNASDPDFPLRAGNCDLAEDVAFRRTYLRQGVRYYWRVRGVDLSDVSGTVPTVLGRFSDTRSFMYLPGVPEPTGPFGGTVSTPKLSWIPVPGVERYQVFVYLDGDLHIDSIVHGTSYVPTIVHKKVDGVLQDADISWTVRALQVDATGSGNGGAGPTVTGPSFTLSATEPGGGGSPGLVAPASGASLVHPEFDWSPVSGASHYVVRLYPAGSDVGTDLYDKEQGESGTRRFTYRSAFTPTLPIAPGAYEWQVLAYGEGGSLITTSGRRPITIADLELVTPTAPADCAEGSSCTVHPATPLMQWEEVPWAAFYRVHVALDEEFTNVRQIYTTTQTSLRPYEELLDNTAGQSYHWFVQPCRTKTVCGRFNSSVYGTARAFRKTSRPITLLSPADGSRVANQITFSWRALSTGWVGSDDDDDLEAEYYRIDVSRTHDFSAIIDTADVDQTTYTAFLKTYEEGPIYWRVQGFDSTGNALTSSVTRVVHKSSPLPEVTAPASGAEVGSTPVVRWEPQPFAAKYEIEYYRNGDTSWTPANKVTGTGLPNPRRVDLAADALPIDLAPGTYAYRVRRIDVDGRVGPWSSDPPPPSTNPADGDRRTFTVVGQAPTLTSPANDTVYSQPRIQLEWNPVPGASSYQVQTSMSAGFGGFVENVNTVMTTFSLVKAHVTGTIHWRVTALDGQGNPMGTSENRRIVQDLTRPTSSLPKVVAGPASVLVSWVGTAAPASGPITSYVITPYIGGTTPGTPVTVGGDETEVRVTGLVNDKSYKFTVTPHDANGIGTESVKSATVTPRKLAPFTSTDKFITRQYQDFQGRAPTGTELAAARTQLQGSMTPEAFIDSLWTRKVATTDHANVMPQITRLYSAFYLRIPDADGLLYWAGERRKGVSLAVVAEKFTQVQEFRTLYGTKTNAQYVDLVYWNVLNREPSTADRNYWRAELDSRRITRGRLMIGFSESEEYRVKFEHEINAALVMIEMLRRTPTIDERDELVEAMEGGQTMRETFLALMGSTEYAARGGL